MAGEALNKSSARKWTNIDAAGASTGEFDYISGVSLASPVTLTTAQSKTTIIEVTTGHASNVITIAAADAIPGSLYILANGDATLAAGLRVGAGAAVTVAATKTAILRVNSAGNIARVTADV